MEQQERLRILLQVTLAEALAVGTPRSFVSRAGARTVGLRRLWAASVFLA